MRVANVGFRRIDVYEKLNWFYPTGNGVDFCIHLSRMGIDTSIVSVAGDDRYAHARFLRSYGAAENNSTGHLKSMLTGNGCMFPVAEGQIVCGGAQDTYLVEFDGPQQRKIFIPVQGE